MRRSGLSPATRRAGHLSLTHARWCAFPRWIFRLMAQRWCTGTPSGRWRAGAGCRVASNPDGFRPAGAARCPDCRLYACASGRGVTSASATGARPCEIACATCWFAQCCYSPGCAIRFIRPTILCRWRADAVALSRHGRRGWPVAGRETALVSPALRGTFTGGLAGQRNE